MYKINEDIIFSNRDKDTLVIISVLDTENSYYKVNGIARNVFLELSEGKSLTDIKSSILEKYEVEEEKLEHDIDEFLQFLLKNNVITKK